MGNENEGFMRTRESEDEDVEGHRMQPREGYSKQPRATEDEDVEGHSFKTARNTGE